MNLLETINLKKYFGDTHAVDNVSLTVAEREFVSLVGPNGAGKTSLINVISALLPSDSGKILFKGDDITQSTVTERVKAGIARSFQIVNLFDDLTAFDNVTLAIFSRQGKTANLAALAHLDHAVSAEAARAPSGRNARHGQCPASGFRGNGLRAQQRRLDANRHERRSEDRRQEAGAGGCDQRLSCFLA